MKKQPTQRSGSQGYASYLRFLGLGLTMAGTILVSTFLGWWIDGLLEWRVPVFTVVLALGGVVGAMAYLFMETKPRR